MKHLSPAIQKQFSIRAFVANWFFVPILLLLTYTSNAQAPTSLQYPTPNVVSIGSGSVFYSPTVSGSVSSYSITPSLPGGISFNVNTGVISGVPTTTSLTTIYTVTATNSFGSTTGTISIQITSPYFNVGYNTLSFVNSSTTVTNLKGNGTHQGDSVLYKKVITISGQAIDCIVTTYSLTNVSSFDAYDQEATSGTYYTDNLSQFFSPQLNFSAAGSVIFKFHFILGNSYVNSANPGTSVILQNVRVNTYDIDGNGSTNSNQYNEFDGFDTSELGNPTNIVATYNATTGLTKFRSNTSTNTISVTDSKTRLRLTYNSMSDFSLNVGADAGGTGTNGLAYFFVDFSTGSVAFSTAVKDAAPAIDLDTTIPGVNNAGSACSAPLNFTGGSNQTNVHSSSVSNFTQLSLKYATASILDGANEKLLVNGATLGGSIALNANPSVSNLTLGGVVYSVSGSVTAGYRTLVFTRNAGSFVTANIEALLDAFQYQNTSSTRTNGIRAFIVNARNAAYESPNAVFTATINCGKISGNIWHDANGLSDNTVNANGPNGQFAAASAYAVLVNPTTNAVMKTTPILAGGAYTFGSIDTGSYNIFISNTSTPGTTLTTPSYPNGGYISTGENLGAGAGNDQLIDGKLRVTLGTLEVTNANFGIQIPPTTVSSTYSNIPNPGGFNVYAAPTGAFGASDVDGTIDSIKITSFPTGANYLKIGSDYYSNPVGGQCPPQASCKPWAGSVSLAYADVATVAVDPSADGNTTVVIPFTAKDNGLAVSNDGTPSGITLNFIAQASPILVSGNVWNDADGSGTKNGSEPFTNAAGSGEVLYAILVQSSNTYSGDSTIYAVNPVGSDGTYSFSNVPANNSYEVRIVSSAALPQNGANLNTVTPKLAPRYIGVSTSNNGTIATYAKGTLNPRNILGLVTTSKTSVNFGIEQTPTADSKTFSAPNTAFTKNNTITIDGIPTYGINGNSSALQGSSLKSLSGNDPEDCASASSCALGKKYLVSSINANTLLYYDFGAGPILVSANTAICNFNPANLTIYGKQGQGFTSVTALGFNYSLVDNAGIVSTPVSYIIRSADAPLPIVLSNFKATVEACSAIISWSATSMNNAASFEIQRSNNGINFESIGTVIANQNAAKADYEFTVTGLNSSNYFRLKQVDLNGSESFSNVLRVDGGKCANTFITASPNPVVDVLNIHGISASTATVLLYNSIGSVVTREIVIGSDASLNLSSLPSGVYQLRIIGQDGNMLYSGSVLKR